MAADHTMSKPNLGFLTVLEHPQHGLFGGYLVLNAAARPLEFHCTAPIKPNRAQEILYGPTLQSFLYGEQIGRTLLEKAKNSPEFVFVGFFDYVLNSLPRGVLVGLNQDRLGGFCVMCNAAFAPLDLQVFDNLVH